MLNKAGIMALHLPLISIIAGQELNRLPNKLQQLNCGDYVVAVSKNAVEYAQKTLSAIEFLLAFGLILLYGWTTNCRIFCEPNRKFGVLSC